MTFAFLPFLPFLHEKSQRTIQNQGNPIILTGAAALNKVLGREVYSSNLQIGGTQIMYTNGVSHLVAKDDYDGVLSIMKWLSYVPNKKGGNLPTINSIDPVDRPVDFYPPKTPYDPRVFFDSFTSLWLLIKPLSHHQ